jgi:hypothetical protein
VARFVAAESSQGPEQLADISYQRGRFFHGGEVAAPVEIGPPRDGVAGFGELPDPHVVGEHDRRSGHATIDFGSPVLEPVCFVPDSVDVAGHGVVD